MKPRSAGPFQRAREDGRLPWIQVALLCAVIFLSPLIAGKLMDPVPEIAVQALVLVTALVWLAGAARRGSIDLPGGRIVAILGIFFLLLILSAIDSVGLHATLLELLNVGTYLLVFLMVAGIGSNRQAVFGILAAAVLSSALVGAIGLKEYMLAGGAGWRTFSTFFNPDFLAGFMALMLPVALAWYLSRLSPGISAVACIVVLLIIGNILLSGSRFGMAAALAGLGIFAVLGIASRSIKRGHLARLAVLAPLAAIIFHATSAPLSGRITSVRQESHSGGFRIYTWKGALRMASAHPVNGSGLGTFDVAYPRHAIVGYTDLAHNSYLQLAAEAGPLAAVSLLALLGSIALPTAAALIRRRLTKDAQVAKDFAWTPDAGLMLSGLLGGAAASMARNLVDSDWYVTAIGITFWVVLGAAVALGHPGEESRRVASTGPKLVAATAVVGLVLAGTLITLIGEIGLSRGEALLRAGDLEEASDCFQRASALQPFNPESHRRLAAIDMALAQESGDPSYAEHAVAELMVAIRLDPASAKNYYQLGRVYHRFQGTEKAIRAYRSAMERDPHSPQVLLALAHAYEAAGREEDALRIYRRMVGVEESPYEKVRAMPEFVEPAYIFAHAALGRELDRQGMKPAALREYRRALDRIARYRDSVEAMCGVLEASGRRDIETESLVEEVRLDLVRRIRSGE